MKSAVVLLSAGLDSTVNLYAAHKKLNVRLALTFNYGQRAAFSEIRQAGRIAAALNIEHKVIDLMWFKEFKKSALINTSKSVPLNKEVNIDSFETSIQSAEKVWVPNRNGIFLNIAAGFAEDCGADYVVPGFNKEEAQTFPDNTIEFLEATNSALHFSTGKRVSTICFTGDMTKIEIVKYAKELNVPLELIWSCYFDGEKMCGECESCQRFIRAVEAN